MEARRNGRDTSTNALFRESSDVIRLNDIWYASRNVPESMRLRARIANITGWPLVDTDNASSTNLKEWVELHAGATLDRNPRTVFRLPHRNNTREPLARGLELLSSPLATIYRRSKKGRAN